MPCAASAAALPCMNAPTLPMPPHPRIRACARRHGGAAVGQGVAVCARLLCAVWQPHEGGGSQPPARCGQWTILRDATARLRAGGWGSTAAVRNAHAALARAASSKLLSGSEQKVHLAFCPSNCLLARRGVQLAGAAGSGAPSERHGACTRPGGWAPCCCGRRTECACFGATKAWCAGAARSLHLCCAV